MDKEVLQKLADLLQITFAVNDMEHPFSQGYLLNDEQQVIQLYLQDSKINDLNVILPHLKKFKSLYYLDLSHNKIADISPLKELTGITQLQISNLQITSIKPLESLVNLTRLDLGYNDINDISGLQTLTALEKIHLADTGVTDIDTLKYLINLEELNLSRNNIKDFLPIGSLKKLRKLYLHSNGISNLLFLKGLKKLEGLYMVQNKISDISVLENNKNLRDLYLGINQIADLAVLSQLTNLKRIYLPDNKITDLTPLRSLNKFELLHISGNPFKVIPEWMADSELPIIWGEKDHYYDGGILLYDNPIETPPIEIVRKGNSSIKRFYDKIRAEGIDFIFEAKLTLVGEGNSGKTSLQRRLLNDNASLPQKDTRTRGIEIKDWQFKKTKLKKHIAHVWDFGGQDVYYPVHRFFITENSVFVLLASTRQTHHNFDYWIPTIYQFGGSSPIILGQTCHDGNKIPWNDLGVFISNPNFNIIKTQSVPYFEINLINKNEGLKRIKQTIVNQITALPHYGKGVPKSWVSIRNLLIEESQATACISFDTFKEMCQKLNPTSFANLGDIIDCCQFLHDIGVVLWYSTNDELKDWVILQPEWAMKAVYQIIDDSEIQKRTGNILAKDFNRLWKDKCYENKHTILRKMLEIFKIAFPKKHKAGEYIIPARLISMPNEKRWGETGFSLRLEYRYEFMPRGMVNQISAELSRYINEDEVWNNAVNFYFDSNTARCQVEEDFYNRKLIIKTSGKDARGLLILVMDALMNITQDYKGVKPEIYVPCSCSKCKDKSRPTTFLYDKLLEWSSQRENARVICNESGDSIVIEELLYNVGLPNADILKPEKMQQRIVNIFLASSSELKVDREKFEIFINRENKILSGKGVFIKLDLWEDFLDAMSKTRLQDEYNEAVRNSDIFVSLFFNKVGKYTSEEFDNAFGQFIKTGKPIIYTYFKDEQISRSKISKTDFDSRYEFEEKLKELGHYPTTYKNMDDLKYQFKMQLEKILPKIK